MPSSSAMPPSNSWLAYKITTWFTLTSNEQSFLLRIHHASCNESWSFSFAIDMSRIELEASSPPKLVRPWFYSIKPSWGCCEFQKSIDYRFTPFRKKGTFELWIYHGKSLSALHLSHPRTICLSCHMPCWHYWLRVRNVKALVATLPWVAWDQNSTNFSKISLTR